MLIFAFLCALVHPTSAASPSHDTPPLAVVDPLAGIGPSPGAELSAGYLRAEEVQARAQDLAERLPGRVQALALGESVESRPITAYRVADPGTPVRRSMLVFAGIHALEWISTEVALAFLDEVARRPPPGVELVVLPLLNVDGRARVEGDLDQGRLDRYRRANAHGVDLNRNFAVHTEPRAIWRHLLPAWYRVPETPLSEPEARIIDQLGARGFDVAVSLHAFGGYHFLPWAGRSSRPPGWPALWALGQTLERGQGRGAYRAMQLSRWAFFFRGHGMEIDHLYGQYGIPAVLIELTRSGVRGPADLETPFRWYNPRDPARHRALGVQALLAVARRMAWELRTGEAPAW